MLKFIGTEKDLQKYGFYKAEENDEYSIIDNEMVCCIGLSRRGQFYYIILDSETKKLTLYASEADGSGGSVEISDELYDMIRDGKIEKYNY
jgi:hypothetical protein